ncbi:MAG: histidine kinase [Saprospiraceae bacterium]|nr:histidine kinase [Saprospiraceae bacterium]
MKRKPHIDNGPADSQNFADLQAQLDCLKSQVNPHFLFNNLSILSSLVQVNPDLSERFIVELSHTYRYILDQGELELVPLRTEMDFIASFAFLLKIRFENKFDLIARIDEQDMDRYQIAPLTLQLLVENAIAHNAMSVKEPLVVEIFIQDANLLVKNRLQQRPVYPQRAGCGLYNLANRYALVTNRPVWAGPIGDEFVVKVPLLEGEKL